MTEKKRRKISPGRKKLFYSGRVLSLIGLAVILSTFVTFASNFGNFDNFDGMFKTLIIRSFIGVALIMTGALMTRVGRTGAAGSGLVLDPEQAREDLEPWSRMGGGMLSDALEEVDDLQNLGGEDRIKVRCRSCKELNDEDAKFCDQCGADM